MKIQERMYVLDIIERIIRLQEHAKNGEYFSADYIGAVDCLTYNKHVEEKEDHTGGLITECFMMVYPGRDYGDTLDDLEAEIRKEEIEHDL